MTQDTHKPTVSDVNNFLNQLEALQSRESKTITLMQFANNMFDDGYRYGLEEAAEIAESYEKKYLEVDKKDVLDEALWASAKVTATVIAKAIREAV